MADQEHLEILLQGKEVWKEWKLQHLDLIVDLTGADLSGADLSSTELTRVDLSHANLSRADLSGAYLSGAKFERANLGAAKLVRTYLPVTRFVRADLERADLSGANLEGANFSRANLTGADLSRANLLKAHFTLSILNNVNLAGADMNNSQLGYTQLGNLDLSTAIGLSTVQHYFPSTLGVDTLYRSGGNIPESFLRGCGLRDWEIEAFNLYRTDLTPARATEILYRVHELRTNPAIQFHSCFISYSSKDQSFTDNLYESLQEIGVRCWYAPESMKIGDKFRQRIDEAIRIHDKLLVVLSKNSISSAWVEEEVESALEREHKEDRLILFPIQVDDSVMSSDRAWAASLRRMRHIGDFSSWRDRDLYCKAFERLLRDLSVRESSPDGV